MRRRRGMEAKDGFSVSALRSMASGPACGASVEDLASPSTLKSPFPEGLSLFTKNFSSCPMAQSRPTALDADGCVRTVPHNDGATFGTGEYASKVLRTER